MAGVDAQLGARNQKGRALHRNVVAFIVRWSFHADFLCHVQGRASSVGLNGRDVSVGCLIFGRSRRGVAWTSNYIRSRYFGVATM